jgi:hypothetical protein
MVPVPPITSILLLPQLLDMLARSLASCFNSDQLLLLISSSYDIITSYSYKIYATKAVASALGPKNSKRVKHVALDGDSENYGFLGGL